MKIISDASGRLFVSLKVFVNKNTIKKNNFSRNNVVDFFTVLPEVRFHILHTFLQLIGKFLGGNQSSVGVLNSVSISLSASSHPS